MLHFDSNSTKVIYENETYTGIIKIGLYEDNDFGNFCINLFSSRRCEFYTSIGISSKEWRKDHPNNKAGYKVVSPTHLIIFNDIGHERSLQIEDEEIIQKLIDELKSEDLIAY